MSILNNIWIQVLFFLILACAIALAVSAYRDDDKRAIFKGFFRRFFKITGFTFLLAIGLVFIEWAFF